MGSISTTLGNPGIDKLDTNKLQESANDENIWNHKNDEVLRDRGALDSE